MKQFIPVSLLAAVVAGVALVAPQAGPAVAAESRAGCNGLRTGVSDRNVEPGDALRVFGRACRSNRVVYRRVAISVRTADGLRLLRRAPTGRAGRFSRWVRMPVGIGARPRIHISAAGLRRDRRYVARALRIRRLRLISRRQSVVARPASPASLVAEQRGSATHSWQRASHAPDRKPASDPSEPSPTGERDRTLCALSDPSYEVKMALEGCRTVASDTASASDPRGFWGNVECASSSQHRLVSQGGDAHVTATGASQGNGSYRRMTVFDGDDVWGERCELGKNDHRDGPTAFYREGMRRVTYVSLRLPDNFDSGTGNWQTVMQMKQAQPSDGGGGIPILEMQAYRDKFSITSSQGEYWKFPVVTGEWVRFAFDVTYSQSSRSGRLQVSADLDRDGSFDGEGERSPRFEAETLKTEIEGRSDDGVEAGDPIPSHLRAGIYHDEDIPCPSSSGCSVEVDNVQVMAP